MQQASGQQGSIRQADSLPMGEYYQYYPVSLSSITIQDTALRRRTDSWASHPGLLQSQQLPGGLYHNFEY